MKSLKILYVGPLSPGGTCRQRLEALKTLGHMVEGIGTDAADAWRDSSITARICNRLFRYGLDMKYGFRDTQGLNKKIMDRCSSEKFDVLWIDKGLMVNPATLSVVKEHQKYTRIIGYSPDDMAAKHNQSPFFLEGLPLYDAFITTKSFGVEELKAMGCARVEFCENAYDPATHRPIEVGDEKELGGEVGFIGSYEKERAESICSIAISGNSVRIWGKGWERCRLKNLNLRIEHADLSGADYARAVASFKINLCFLRKMNRDVQTTRSVEIPACGGFMLGERTAEHMNLFKEGIEAEYFGDDTELIAKVKCYLADEEKRKSIARAGRERCISCGYSYESRLGEILEKIFN